MGRSARECLLLGSVIVLSACNDAVGAPTGLPTAALLINGVENVFISAGASMASERVDDLYGSGQLSDIALGSGLVQRYTDIASAFEDPISATTALSHMDWIITRLNAAAATSLTTCARTELLRQAQHVRSMIVRATTAGAIAPNQNDVTPYNKGAWPWGGCPFAAPAQNLNVTIVDGRATITWHYSASGASEEFVVYEVGSTGLVQRVNRLDADDCGDAVGNCRAGQRLVSWSTTASNLAVQVDTCVGLNCTPARAAARVPDPLTDVVFSAGGAASPLVLSWATIVGAEYYELTRSGLGRTVTLTQASYSDLTARSSGTTYTYSIRACNSRGCSAVYNESYRR